jgi:hypothetical protein
VRPARPWLIFLAVLPACAAVSGLSALEVVDDAGNAGPDGERLDTGNGGSDGSPPADGGGPEGSSTDGADGMADSPASDPGIACGTKECSADGGVCCINAANRVCATGPCTGGLEVRCDDLADCAYMQNAICCAPQNQNGTITAVRCALPTQCSQGVPTYQTLCDPKVPGVCGTRTCQTQQNGQLQGYSICK